MTDEEKRKKVIFAIENCLTTDGVTECRKTECPFISCRESCLEWLLRSALALLRKQIPRVMTLDEVREDQDRIVWIECQGLQTQIIGQYRGQSGWYANCATEWELFVTMSFAPDYLRYRADKYGKKWRCWTARPDEQVRRDTPWERG